MKLILYAIMAIAFLFITFFGLGPVLFADGAMTERLMTLAVVILIYTIIIFITFKITKHYSNVKR